MSAKVAQTIIKNKVRSGREVTRYQDIPKAY